MDGNKRDAGGTGAAQGQGTAREDAGRAAARRYLDLWEHNVARLAAEGPVATAAAPIRTRT